MLVMMLTLTATFFRPPLALIMTEVICAQAKDLVAKENLIDRSIARAAKARRREKRRLKHMDA